MKITNIEQLFSLNINGIYELDCDIDCKGVCIDKIVGDFCGKFDGKGHTIYNINLQDNIRVDEQPLGLIHSVSESIIRNLNISIESIRFRGDLESANYSVFCSDAYKTTFENIYIKCNCKDNIPFVYSSNNCIYKNINCMFNDKKQEIVKIKYDDLIIGG